MAEDDLNLSDMGGIPQAYVDRLKDGDAFGRTLSRAMSAAGTQVMKDLGSPAEWGFSPENEAAVEKFTSHYPLGIGAVPHTITSSAAWGADAINHLLQAGGGLAAGLIAGATSREQDVAKNANELDLAAQLAGIVAGMHMPTRLDPVMGRVIEKPVGGIPMDREFTNAAVAIASRDGTPRLSPQVLDKLGRLWNEYGIHPAEVATDMHNNPGLAQEMLSESSDLPTHYSGLTQNEAIPDWPNWTLEAQGSIVTRRLPNGEVVPTTGEIGSHLEEFGRRAGFRFQVGPATSTYEAMQEQTEAGPSFARTEVRGTKGNVIQVRAHIYMPDNPDYQMQAWMGLDRSQILYHEAGHALDYFALNGGENTTRMAQIDNVPGLYDEIREAQKKWSPKLTEEQKGYKATPAEMMADAIGAWLSNPEIRKSMPIFTKEFGKKLNPYLDIVNGTLPVMKEGKWVPPHEEAPKVGPSSLKGIGGGGAPPPDIPRWWEPHFGEEPPRPWAALEDKSPALADAHDYLRDKISRNESTPTPRWSFNDFYTHFVDKFTPARKAVEAAAVKPSLAAEDPYKMLRLFADWAGKAHNWLRNEQFGFHSYAKIGPSLEDILKPVNDDLERFTHFVVAARALELERRGINTGLDVSILQHLGNGQYISKYGSVMEDLVKYQNNLSAYLRDSGVLSKAAYEQMLEANKLYVPFHRVLENPEFFDHAGIGRNNLQAWNPIRPIKGADLRIIDPIESVVKNTYLLHALAAKNEVGLKLINLLEKGGAMEKEIGTTNLPVPDVTGARKLLAAPKGMDDLTEALAGAAKLGGTDTISVYRNGIRTTYRVGDDLAAMMKGLDQQTANWMERSMSKFASYLRAGAVLDPAFQMRHLFRDLIYAVVTTAKGIFTPLNMADGMMSAFLQDKAYWEWRKAGGGQQSFVTLNRNYLQHDLRDLTGQTGLFTRSWNVVVDPNASYLQKAGAVLGLPFQPISRYIVHPLQLGTEIATSASHLGAFKRSMRQQLRDRAADTFANSRFTPNLPALLRGEEGQTISGLPAKGEYVLAPGVSLKDAVKTDSAGKQMAIEAAWTSRNTAVDAARIGAKMNVWNSIAAFSNIAIQDSDRIVRALGTSPLKTLTMLGATITLPSLALWAMNKDDSRYQALPAWEKDAFWIIPTDHWEPPSHIEMQRITAGQSDRPRDQFRVIDGELMVNNGTIFRVPKPFQAGVVFGSIPERLAEEFYQHNPKAFEGLISSLMTAAGSQTLLPNAFGPIVSQMNNRDAFTGRTLIPGYAEKFLPEYQFTPYTSDTAKTVGRLMSAFPGMEKAAMGGGFMGGFAHALTSPALIDNYIRAWTGNLGEYALQAADYGLRKSGLNEAAGVQGSGERPEWKLADVPVARAFVARYPGANSQNVEDFYSDYFKAKSYHDTLNGEAQSGNMQAIREITATGENERFEALDGLYKSLSNQLKMIRWIDQNPKVAAYEKRQLIDQLYFGALRTADQGAAVLQQMKK